jgi:hypothetical protein
MTLVATEPGALFFAEPAPQSGNLADVTAWADRTFRALAQFLARPQFAGIVLTRVDAVLWPEFKPEAGMLIYAGPGTLGPQEGLYVYESGTWKKLAGT